MRGLLVLGASFVAVGLWLGCSSSSDGGGATPAPEASTTDDLDVSADALDFGAPSDTYPAFQPSVPQVVDKGGIKLHDVTIVPVLYASDTDAANVPDMLAKYAASSVRKAHLDEYGVTSMTIAPAVTIADAPPTSLTNDQIRAWLRDRLDGSHPEFGANDPATIAKTIYVLVYPSGTSITQAGGGKSCVNFQGYHESAPLAKGADAGADGGTLGADARPIYAVLPRCSITGLGSIETLTGSIVHEVIEAATDPLRPEVAYSEVDADHLAWQASLSGGEIADLCDVGTSFFNPPEVGYVIVRSWSNLSAKGHHDPCVPPPSGAYFNTSAVVSDSIPVDNGFTRVTGVTLKKGESKTIDVQYWSDAPTTGPWTVTAKEWATSTKYPLVLDVALDKTTGVNGEKGHLTITAKDVHPLGRSLVMLLSKLDKRQTLWFVWVATTP